MDRSMDRIRFPNRTNKQKFFYGILKIWELLLLGPPKATSFQEPIYTDIFLLKPRSLGLFFALNLNFSSILHYKAYLPRYKA